MSSAEQIDSVRSKGVNIMIKIRDGSDAGDTSVREFVVPKLNWLAMDYTEIIDFSNVKITEPVHIYRFLKLKLFGKLRSKLSLFPTTIKDWKDW